MKLKILTLGAGLALAAGAVAYAADAPAGGDQRREERVVIICDGGPGGPGMHGPGGPGGHGAMFADMHGKLDANGDGSITRDEFRAMHDEMFGKLDANHDGKLSGDEMHHGPGGPGEERIEVVVEGPDGDHGPHGPGGPGMHGCGPGGPGDMAWSDEGGDNVRIIRHGPGGPDGHDDMDANNDGKISFDEFVGPMREHFNEADKNHNGFLDKEEMTGDHQFVFRRVERH